MANIEEKIKEIEEEIQNTKYNKATQHHIGKLKAKLARLKDELERRRGVGKGITSYAVRKSGNATVALVGFPSTGKSTILNRLTDAKSEIGEYEFTTLNVIPGIMEYKGAKIQILDLPGLVKGASKGKGRGKEVLSVIRSADLILLILDNEKNDADVLIKELYNVGIRLNQRPADIVITKRERGGINVSTTVELTKIDDDLIASILNEYGIINADVVIRDDINEDQLIDSISKNKVYCQSFIVFNKIDLLEDKELERFKRKFSKGEVAFISAEKGVGIEELKERIFNTMRFIRIYMRPQGGETDYEEPLVIKKNSNVGMVCDILHRDFRRKFRYALVWGKSAKFPGQMVGLNHVLEDKDVLTIIVRK